MAMGYLLYRMAYNSSPRSTILQTITITSADLNDMTGERYYELITQMAAALNVPRSAVALRIEPGSVILHYTITTVGAQATSATAAALSALLSNSTSASAILSTTGLPVASMAVAPIVVEEASEGDASYDYDADDDQDDDPNVNNGDSYDYDTEEEPAARGKGANFGPFETNDILRIVGAALGGIGVLAFIAGCYVRSQNGARGESPRAPLYHSNL